MIDTATILVAAGALFVGLGLWRRRDTGHAVQSRTWLRVGLIFCALAAWLRWQG